MKVDLRRKECSTSRSLFDLLELESPGDTKAPLVTLLETCYTYL